MKVRGFVQGVFFRETVCRIASHYDLHGFVRNVGHDIVEIEAEGDPYVLSSFIGDILAHPPHGARIDDVRTSSVPVLGEQRFSVKPSIR